MTIYKSAAVFVLVIKLLVCRNKICLVPTKIYTPWEEVSSEDVKCPLNPEKTSETWGIAEDITIEIDTTDVFTYRIPGTLSRIIQFETCCVSKPLWFNNEVKHSTFQLNVSTSPIPSEGIPEYPDPVCNNEIFSVSRNCLHNTYQIDRQHYMLFSPIQGFPPEWKCDVDAEGVVSCSEKGTHTRFTGFMKPSSCSKNSACPETYLDMFRDHIR